LSIGQGTDLSSCWATAGMWGAGQLLKQLPRTNSKGIWSEYWPQQLLCNCGDVGRAGRLGLAVAAQLRRS